MSILQNKRLKKAFTWVVIGVYLAAALWLFGVHEPWRDEAHAWQIAVSSGSFVELLSAAPYEGSPVLWHLLLWVIDIVGGSFVWARLLNLLFVLCGVVLFVWKAPLRLWQRVLFPFGYFILFEFSTVSRSYGLSVLLLLLVAWVWKHRKEQPLLVAAVLALLAHTHIFGWIIAVVLSGFAIIEYIYTHYISKKESTLAAEKPSYIVALVIAIAGVVSVPIFLMPHADVSPHLLGVVSLDAAFWTHVCTQALRIFVPLSSIELQFWNNVWNPGVVEISLGALLLVASVFIYRLYAIQRRWIIMYLLISAATIGLLAIKGIQHIRFSGILFVVWLACLWIGRVDTPYEPSKRFRTVADYLVGIILLTQVVALAPAVLFESAGVFSQAQPVAAYLEQEGYSEETVLLASGFTSVGTAVLPHLERETLFAPELGAHVERILWDRAYHDGVLYSPEEVVAVVEQEYATGEYSSAVILFNDPHGEEFMGYTLEAAFTTAIVPDEEFYIYKRK